MKTPKRFLSTLTNNFSFNNTTLISFMLHYRLYHRTPVLILQVPLLNLMGFAGSSENWVLTSRSLSLAVVRHNRTSKKPFKIGWTVSLSSSFSFKLHHNAKHSCTQSYPSSHNINHVRLIRH